MYTTYGPGDAATWPAPTGHAGDPRAEDDDLEVTEEEALDGQLDDALLTPGAILEGLDGLCGMDREPIADRIDPSREDEPSAGRLLVALLSATTSDHNRRIAAMLLREALRDVLRTDEGIVAAAQERVLRSQRMAEELA